MSDFKLQSETVLKMCEADPRLAGLILDAMRRAADREPADYDGRLRELLGPGRPDRHPILGSPAALAIARRVVRTLARTCRRVRWHPGLELTGADGKPHGESAYGR